VGVDVWLEKVSRTYRSATAITALRRVSLQVPADSAVAVTGPSGSGKSTLLHVIGAMDRADEGRIKVGERDVTSLSRREQAEYRRTIGFVFQRFHLLPALTVLDNVLVPVLPYRTQFDKNARGRQLLHAVGLGGRAADIPSQLSGGEQQRLAIARALINSPELLLADEPTGNLDSETSLEIMELLIALRKERGMTIIVATHDPLIATRCERIVRLSDGAVIEDMRIAPVEGPEDVLDRINRPGPGS
jgi:putative ABC transport system ATP-binding protein